MKPNILNSVHHALPSGEGAVKHGNVRIGYLFVW